MIPYTSIRTLNKAITDAYQEYCTEKDILK